MRLFLVFGLLVPAVASAADCSLPTTTPNGYDAVAQQDFLANYFALSLNDSPIHAPIPDEPGHGHIGLQLAVIPPLSCGRRLVEYESPRTQVPPSGKFETTNKTPAAPRLAFGFTFPSVKGWDFYGSMVYLPPIPVFGTTNVILGGEVGVGRRLGDHWSAGLRADAQTTKTVGDTASAFQPTDPAVADLYDASTMGLDAELGYHAGTVRPYVMLGLLDVSTFYYVGDDGVENDNLHPYFGPEFAVGIDNAPKKSWFRWGAEFYGAPGGYSTPPGVTKDTVAAPFGRYGHLYTVRLQAGVAI